MELVEAALAGRNRLRRTAAGRLGRAHQRRLRRARRVPRERPRIRVTSRTAAMRRRRVVNGARRSRQTRPLRPALGHLARATVRRRALRRLARPVRLVNVVLVLHHRHHERHFCSLCLSNGPVSNGFDALLPMSSVFTYLRIYNSQRKM